MGMSVMTHVRNHMESGSEGCTTTILRMRVPSRGVDSLLQILTDSQSHCRLLQIAVNFSLLLLTRIMERICGQHSGSVVPYGPCQKDPDT
jgi:hypothetical protein